MAEDLKALKQHPSILRLYNERLRLTKDGKEYKALCPLHQERSPSFTLHLHEGTWIYTCFGCNASGSIVDLIAKMDNCSIKDAITTIQAYVGESSSTWESTREVDAVFHSVASEPKTYRTLTIAQYAPLEKAFAANDACQAWLKSRGISADTAAKLRFGYKQGIGSAAGDKNQDIADKGWISFPSLDGDTIQLLKYRSVVRKAFARQPGMATVLYNLNDVDPLEALYVVEGEPDCAVMKQAEFACIALPSGSMTVTPEMKDQIMAADTVILAGDCDGGVGSQIMERLYKDLGDRTYLLKWPEGKKDANQTYLESCGGDVSRFRTLVDQLTVDAKGNPMPEFTSIQKALTSSNRTSLADHPHRLRFPWVDVDQMAILLPGSVTVFSATNTGMGKTCAINQLCLHLARKCGEIPLNYQCELSADEIANMTAANVLRRERNSLTSEDNHMAARLLKDAHYYVGSDPTLNGAVAVLDLLEKAIRRLGATVVVLDHIHYLCRGDDELQQQSVASKRIKQIAQTYGVKFIVVAQPRKADSKSKGKSLHITDIKGSGAIIDDADALYVLHRNYVKSPDPDNPPTDMYESETEIHCLKARSKGNGGAFSKLFFHGALATFADISHMEPPQ